MRKKLTVTRDAYKRKSYTRKDGTKVKAAKVPASRFKIKDRGKVGRTPVSERFYNPTVHMGWEKTQPSSERRRLALKSHNGDALSTARALQALSNVNPDSQTKKLAGQDARYFFKMHKSKNK